MTDDELNEKFRETAMHLERFEAELKLLRLAIDIVQTKVDRVKDELTLPSGKMNQRFSGLEDQLEQLGAVSTG